MKNLRVDLKSISRWMITIAFLLFVIIVSNEVIQLVCERQDHVLMNERAEEIEHFILEPGMKGRLPQMEAELSHYARQEKIHISLFDGEGRLIYATDKSAAERLAAPRAKQWPVYKERGNLTLYINYLDDLRNSQGYLQVAAPRSEVAGLNAFYVFFFLAGISLLIYRDILERTYEKPVRFAVRMTESVLDGNYDLIASDNVKRESILHMNLALNRLTERLHDMDRTFTRQKNSMETLIENIGNGLILIDGNHRISYINQIFKDELKTDAVHWLMADYAFAIPFKDVKDMIDSVFETKKRVTRQLQLTVSIERRYFDVSCAPILDHHQKARGIVVVFHDITDIKRLESMRKDFVANVSHELRTPITSIIGFTETLLDGAKDDQQSEEQFLNIILHEGKRLQSLVADLLDLSKIEREHFDIDWQEVSLAELLDTVLLIFKDQAAERHIEIDRLPGPAGAAAGDPFRIRQIMINLINNAIAYTPENGKISLSVQESETTSCFQITDTGIGIAADQIPRIFERFYRVDKARSRDSGGTGLGLAIVKHLVEAHGGKIEVRSIVGKGTTFILTFRKKAPVIG
ncbi:MAG: two-component system histidine kinase PnpS [Sporolactobacillus sp.]